MQKERHHNRNYVFDPSQHLVYISDVQMHNCTALSGPCIYELHMTHMLAGGFFPTGTSQLVTRSTRHTVKLCNELTAMSDATVMS